MKARTVLWLLVFVLLQLVLRSPFLTEPLERDEGVYGYLGQRILAGALPYRDVFDHKPPVVYYLYAAAFTVLPDNLATVRLGGVLAGIISLLLIFFIARRLWGVSAGLWAAFLYAVFSVGPYSQGTSSNTEVFMMVFLLGSLLAYLDKKMLLAGLLGGLAVMTKTTAVFNCLVLWLACGCLIIKKEQKPILLLMLSLGLLIAPACFGLYFYAQGAWIPFWQSVVIYNLNYVSPGNGLAGIFIWPWRMAAAENALIWILTGTAVYLIIRFERNRENLLLLGWLLASFVGVCAAGHFYGHYFIQVIPALVLLSVFSICKFKARPEALIIVAVGLGLVGLMALNLYTFYTLYNPAEISLHKYPGENFPATRLIAAGMAANSRPGEYVFFWGAQPEIYFYSRRLCPTRYTYDYPLFGDSQFARAARAELISDLQRNKPKIIVKWKRANFYQPLQALVRRYYRPAYLASPIIDVYMLK